MAMVDISGLDKAEVLYALYNSSHYQGISFLGMVNNYTLEDCRKDFEESKSKYFDYLHGKVIKVNLSGDNFDPFLYDRDCGEGAAQEAIDKLRKSC